MGTNLFAEIQVGHEVRLKRVISESDITKFSDLTGDNNPLHMDEAFALRTPMRGRVVHGMLTASLISTLIGTRLSGPGCLWVSQNLSFLKPARVGDEVEVIGTVIARSESQRLLKLETIVERTADGARLVEGEAEVKVMPVDDERSETEVERINAALVTGSGRGIGAAVASRLAAAGHPVVVNYLKDEASAGRTVELIRSAGGSALAIQADMGDPEAVTQMVRQAEAALGPVDVVVHNASPAMVPKDVLDCDRHDLERYFKVQVLGLQSLAKAVVPSMISRGGGSIVVIGSTITDGVPPTGSSCYAAAKAACQALCRSLAAELGPKNVRVNMVSPGMSDTRMTADMPEKAKLVEKFHIPLRKFATADEIADAVVFFAGATATHITGANLRVSGGKEML